MTYNYIQNYTITLQKFHQVIFIYSKQTLMITENTPDYDLLLNIYRKVFYSYTSVQMCVQSGKCDVQHLMLLILIYEVKFLQTTFNWTNDICFKATPSLNHPIRYKHGNLHIITPGPYQWYILITPCIIPVVYSYHPCIIPVIHSYHPV